MIGSKAKLSCKPFKNSHEEQIKLVSSFDWLDIYRLFDIDEELWELMRGSVFIDSARCDALCFALRERVDMLSEVVNSRRTWTPVDDHHSDVIEDIAYSGKEVLER